MLNDIAWPTRLLLAGFGGALGVMASGPVSGASSSVGFATVFAGLALEMVVILTWPIVLGLAERTFRAHVVAASSEIAAGAVEPVEAVGRVVRRRVVDLPWWVPGRGGGPGQAALTVFTVVGDGPARRVAALVPADLGLRSKDVPALLLVHPRHRDIAVLDDRVTAERLHEVDADPRWQAERLPTDRTVVGGYLGLLLAFALGAAVVCGVSTLVLTLAT